MTDLDCVLDDTKDAMINAVEDLPKGVDGEMRDIFLCGAFRGDA